MTEHKARIMVLGAINQDEIARVDHHPGPGETIVVAQTDFSPGGKGANQAAAAASSGFAVRVQMIGAVGDDASGNEQVVQLDRARVDTSMIRRVIGTPTGRAFITVTEEGENSIVVALGANAFVSLVNLNGAATPDLAIAQSEIGLPAIEALGVFAAKADARLLVNNAPVVSLSSELLAQADPLVVNRIEAQQMLAAAHGGVVTDDLEIASTLRNMCGARSVVVTLGARGAAIADLQGSRAVPAVAVSRVVDTTGAGDIFIGVLAAALASNQSLDEAVAAASAAAGKSITWRGARTSFGNSIPALASA